MFDGDPLSAINHVEIFKAHTKTEKVFHQDVLMLLFMGSLNGHSSWLHDHEPGSISSIEEFVDGFLRHFQVHLALSIQGEALIKHHQDIKNLGNEQEDESSLGPHDENNDFEDTCAGKDEFMESQIETKPTFLKDTTLDESSFENLERDDPISPLKDDIEDYFHIEKEKWKIFGPQFDCAPIYDTNKEDEDEIGLPFPSGTTYDDIPIDTPRKENLHFPLHKEG